MRTARRELTIELDRLGDLVSVDAHRPGFGKVAQRSFAWAQHGRDFTAHGRAGLEAIAKLLDRGDPGELVEAFTEAHLGRVGALLFETLLGGRGDWEPVLRGAFETPRPNPVFAPLRVRICTTDALLSGLPWRLTTWQAKPLVDYGWTFEASVEVAPSRHVELPAPSRLLVVAPRPAGTADLKTEQHLASLRGALDSVSVHYKSAPYLRVETRRDGLERALRGMRPQILYFYGHAEIRGGQICLLLEDGDRTDALLMADLKRMLPEQAPLVACLNGCKTASAGWYSAGNQLSPEVPLVIANRTTAWTEYAGPAAVRWLTRVLGDGVDPVEALCRLPTNECTRSFQWATATVHANYRSWGADRDPSGVRRPVVGLRLDRDQQRALVHKHVTDLVTSQARRVEAIIAHAAPGNHVDAFATQAIDFLEGVATRRVHLRRLSVRFPESRAELTHRLEAELRIQLDLQPGEPLGHALRYHAPSSHGTGATPVLFLDWGSFGDGDQPPLTPAQIREWLIFCAEPLANACPPELRVVSYLAMEVEEDKHARLADVMDEYRQELFRERFRCALIPALPDLRLVDLLEFLSDRTNTTCPRVDAREAAELIHKQAQGSYAKTIELITSAEETTWAHLLERLRALHTPVPAMVDSDEPF